MSRITNPGKLRNKRIQVGVVGCGYWGPNLIRNFRSLPDCQLTAMCDLLPARLEQLKSLYPEVADETDYRHLLNGLNLDAVVIATGVPSHYPLAKASLLAGKHILIEKPMAASVAQCEELVDLANTKGLVLMTGHTFLYSPVVRKIREIIDQGNIGEICYICARRLNMGLLQKDINAAWDLAPHDLSIILTLMGEPPITVNCQGRAHITPGIEDETTMCLSFSGQRSAVIQSSWLAPHDVREMTIVGSKRMIVYDDVEPIQKIRVFDTRVESPPHYDTFGEFPYAYHYGDVHAPYIKHEEPLKNQCQHFLGCIRSGSIPVSCGMKGLELVRILEASSASLRHGGGPMQLSRGRNEVVGKGAFVPMAASPSLGLQVPVTVPASRSLNVGG